MINEALLVLGMFCVTYFIRYIPLGLSNNFKLPFYFEKGLKSDNIFGNFRFCANSMKGQIYVFVLPFNSCAHLSS